MGEKGRVNKECLPKLAYVRGGRGIALGGCPARDVKGEEGSEREWFPALRYAGHREKEGGRVLVGCVLRGSVKGELDGSAGDRRGVVLGSPLRGAT